MPKGKKQKDRQSIQVVRVFSLRVLPLSCPSPRQRVRLANRPPRNQDAAFRQQPSLHALEVQFNLKDGVQSSTRSPIVRLFLLTCEARGRSRMGFVSRPENG